MIGAAVELDSLLRRDESALMLYLSDAAQVPIPRGGQVGADFAIEDNSRELASIDTAGRVLGWVLAKADLRDLGTCFDRLDSDSDGMLTRLDAAISM